MTLSDGTKKFYTEDYFREVLKSLNPDKNLDLNKISWFFIKDGKIDKANKLEHKEFYQTFLDLIRTRITANDMLFTEFKNKLDNSNNFDTSKNTFTDTEEELLGDLRSALSTIFGYTGFTLLQMGLMVFNKINNKFEIDFIIPSYKTLVSILNKFQIRPLNTKAKGLADTFFNDILNRQRVSLSILFSGQTQLVVDSDGNTNNLYTYPRLDFIRNIFPNYISSVEDMSYHTEAYQILYNTFYSSFGGRERFGQRIVDAKLKLLKILFSDIVDTQINLNTLGRYSPFSTMSASDQEIWLELNQMYYKIALSESTFLPRRDFDPTSILFDIVTGVIQSNDLETTLREKNIANKLAKDYKLNFGVLLSKLTQEDIREIAPALYFTYDHLFRGDVTNTRTILNQYGAMTTDHFWNSIEQPIRHTVDQLKNILTSSGESSFVVQFRRISHSGIDYDKQIRDVVYNAQDKSDLKITDYNSHPEILDGSNILIKNIDELSERQLLQKLYSIVYYMVKYQAFIIVKVETARSKDCLLAGTITKLFILDYIKSLTKDGSKWGTLNLIPSGTTYKNWQMEWNRGNVWSDNNAYIPFYLFPDYKSGILGEGRLKELFLQRFGIDKIDYLTSDYTTRE